MGVAKDIRDTVSMSHSGGPFGITVLASASPRRRQILSDFGFAPIVIPSDADESMDAGAALAPCEAAMGLAERKARAVADALLAGGYADALDGALAAKGLPRSAPIDVVGVDTIVYKGGIIGKPEDEADALRILRILRGARHAVISGVCIVRLAPPKGMAYGVLPCKSGESVIGNGASGEKPSGAAYGVLPCRGGGRVIESVHTFSDVTFVEFGDYSDDEILAYVRANPPYDKSGSYAIQSDWGRHVLGVDGSVENVIGFPIQRIAPLLCERAMR